MTKTLPVSPMKWVFFPRPGTAAERTAWLCVGTVVALFTGYVLGVFHDQFWWPAADGAYAHVAERLLAGEVLNRDVQDVHAGFISLVNALAFRLFGHDLLSLRYPLVALTFVQTGLILFILSPRGPLIAAAGAIAMAALSFVQFLNPSVHWYALFFTVTIVAALAWMPRTHGARLFVLGFLVAMLLLFRQLSGILVGIGVLAFLFLEAAPVVAGKAPRERLVARVALAIGALALTFYILTRTDPFAILVFGVVPIALIAEAIWRTGVDNRTALRMLGRLGAGALVAVLPLLGYHAAYGTIGNWYDDVVVAALRMTELPLFEAAQYGYLKFLVLSGAGIVSPANFAGPINGLFWIAILLLAPAAAILLWRQLMSQREAPGQGVHPLPFLAPFYALVAVHYQTPTYLLFPASVSLAAVLWLAPNRRRWQSVTTACVALFLAAVGLHYQAGQPLDRGTRGILAGVRGPARVNAGIDKAALRVPAKDRRLYRGLIRLIHKETSRRAAILALPFNPELYFLSGRANPVRFSNAAIGMRTDKDLRAVRDALARRPPALVIHRPGDPYNTRFTASIMVFVRANYEPLPPRGGFHVYKLRTRKRPGQ